MITVNQPAAKCDDLSIGELVPGNLYEVTSPPPGKGELVLAVRTGRDGVEVVVLAGNTVFKRIRPLPALLTYKHTRFKLAQPGVSITIKND